MSCARTIAFPFQSERIKHGANKAYTNREPVIRTSPCDPFLLCRPPWFVARDHLFGHHHCPFAAFAQTTWSDAHRNVENILVWKLYLPIWHGFQQEIASPEAEQSGVLRRAAL